MDRIAAKFGGTSVASAEQIRKIAALVSENPARRFLVVSAPGKRTASDRKVTDLLYLCHHVAREGMNVSHTFQPVRARYDEIASDLGIDGLGKELDDVESRIVAGASEDWVASRGEYLHAQLIARFLGASFVDAADCIRFTAGGALDPVSYSRVRDRLSGPGTYVVPGFYGTNASGDIRTFSRGGSDVSGAIVARAVDAATYENWTDVSGLLMADPRIVQSPRPIHRVTYRELRELAYMGANVLHDEAVFPVREADIPIHILNTNSPGDAGTVIVRDRPDDGQAIVGIAGRKGFSTLFVEKDLMNAERGFGRRLLEVLERYEVGWEHAPTSIDTMSVIMQHEEIAGKEELVMRDIRDSLHADRVDMLPDMAMIATVGIGMSRRVGVAGSLFQALSDASINIRMINQGASEINIIVGVEDPDYEEAVRAIYRAFVQA